MFDCVRIAAVDNHMHIKTISSQFLLVTALIISGPEAVAGAKSKVKAAAKDTNPNVSHCGYIEPNVAPVSFNKPESVLLARLIPTEKNSFAVEVLEGSKNTKAKMPIASLAKQKTAYLVFQAVAEGKLSYDDEVPMNPAHYCLPDNNYATKQLPVGVWKFKVSDLLSLMLYQSNNSAALALADAVERARGGENFVLLMNKTAQEWGMKDTHYTSPHGLPPKDRDSEYTTAEDQLILAQNTMVYESEYRRFLNEPLMAAGKPIKTGPDSGKIALNRLQAIWKTATSYKCPSLFTIFNSGSEKFFALQLCTPDGSHRFDSAIKLFAHYRTHVQSWIKPHFPNTVANITTEESIPSPVAR